RMANLIPVLPVPLTLPVRPRTRSVPGSEAVNSTYPPMEPIDCRELAPASAQPSQPPVFVSELPLAVTLTRLVQVTGSPAAVEVAPAASTRTSDALSAVL